MGSIVIIAIAVLLVFVSLVALGCCQAAKDDTEQEPNRLSPELFKTGLAIQYVQLCQDYGVVPEWTDAHLMLFKDDYVFPSDARPIYFNNNIIGYVSFNKVVKITGSSLKAHYEKNVLKPLQVVA